MATIGDALSLQVSLDGKEDVLRGLSSIGDALERTGGRGRNLAILGGDVAALTAEVRLAQKSFSAFASDDTMQRSLATLTGSATTAATQIALIRSESEKGLPGIDKGGVFDAVKLIDEVHGKVQRLLPLSEELALRTGRGLKSAAEIITGLSGGGRGRLQGVLRQSGVSVEELRASGLAITNTYQTQASPQKVLDVLERILNKNGGLASGLAGGPEASGNRLSKSFDDLERSIGSGLEPVLVPLINDATTFVQYLTGINDAARGVPSTILLIGGGLVTLAGIVSRFRKAAESPTGKLKGLANSAQAAIQPIEGMATAARNAAAALDELTLKAQNCQPCGGSGGMGGGGGTPVPSGGAPSGNPALSGGGSPQPALPAPGGGGGIAPVGAGGAAAAGGATIGLGTAAAWGVLGGVAIAFGNAIVVETARAYRRNVLHQSDVGPNSIQMADDFAEHGHFFGLHWGDKPKVASTTRPAERPQRRSSRENYEYDLLGKMSGV